MQDLTFNLQTIRSVGHCIYCGKPKSETKLTREHVIPAALGGEIILEEASCGVCQETINRDLENPINRGLFKSYRTARGYPSRTGHDERLGLRVKKDGVENRIILPASEHPSPIVLPHLPPPGLLLGHTSPQPPQSLNILAWWASNTPPIDIEKADSWLTPAIDVKTFRRYLAKIALGATIAMGIELRGQYLTDIILGRSDEDDLYVGALPQRYPSNGTSTLGWELGMRPFRRHGDNVIVINFRPFIELGNETDHIGPPTYVVVVGFQRTGVHYFRTDEFFEWAFRHPDPRPNVIVPAGPPIR